MRREIIKSTASAVLAALIVFGVVATGESVREGALIKWLGGATATELEQVMDRTSQVAKRTEEVNGRFGKLELMITRVPHGCGPPAPPRCPDGWIDADVRFQNTYRGGDCGRGHQYRLCIRAGE